MFVTILIWEYSVKLLHQKMHCCCQLHISINANPSPYKTELSISMLWFFRKSNGPFFMENTTSIIVDTSPSGSKKYLSVVLYFVI